MISSLYEILFDVTPSNKVIANRLGSGSANPVQILLRLEKFHYRVNFARGILESRNVTYDRSMHKLARPLPLETPTEIELGPGKKIRVTLFDANHCLGAVMFLIEGDGKAVLYTGDVRAETWWVNSLVQNPVLLPYTLGNRRLDCIYLDTTFATKSDIYCKFPSKAEGIRELLEKVSKYPDETIFYFHSWTFGYEHVWIALSSFLKGQIHLDDYRARIYASLSPLERKHLREAGLDVQLDNKFLRASGLEIREAPALCGFRNGNHTQHGCLTSSSHARIHSCERGMGCPVMDHDTEKKIVHILPIVTRVNGIDIAEIGAGGGKGDLDQKEELEIGNVGDVGKLMELCAEEIKDEELLSGVLALLQSSLDEGKGKVELGNAVLKESQDSDDDLSLKALVSVLSEHATNSEKSPEKQNETIRFPYSRHSSYSELCMLVQAFQPKDVFPCTVDEGRWHPTLGMRTLFGNHCSADFFRHDAEMMDMYDARVDREQKGKRGRDESQEKSRTQTSEENSAGPAVLDKLQQRGLRTVTGTSTIDRELEDMEQKELKRTEITDDEIEETEFHTPVESPRTPRHTSELDGQIGVQTASPKLPSFDARTRTPPTTLNAISHEPNTVPEPDPSPTQSNTPLPLQPIASPAIAIAAQAPTSDVETQIPASTSTKKLKSKISKPKLSNKAIAYKAAQGDGLTWADFGGLVSTKGVEEEEEEL
jgi:hypothetical protein